MSICSSSCKNVTYFSPWNNYLIAQDAASYIYSQDLCSFKKNFFPFNILTRMKLPTVWRKFLTNFGYVFRDGQLRNVFFVMDDLEMYFCTFKLLLSNTGHVYHKWISYWSFLASSILSWITDKFRCTDQHFKFLEKIMMM